MSIDPNKNQPRINLTGEQLSSRRSGQQPIHRSKPRQPSGAFAMPNWQNNGMPGAPQQKPMNLNQGLYGMPSSGGMLRVPDDSRKQHQGNQQTFSDALNQAHNKRLTNPIFSNQSSAGAGISSGLRNLLYGTPPDMQDMNRNPRKTPQEDIYDTRIDRPGQFTGTETLEYIPEKHGNVSIETLPYIPGKHSGPAIKPYNTSQQSQSMEESGGGDANPNRRIPNWARDRFFKKRSSLNPAEAQQAWDAELQMLRQSIPNRAFQNYVRQIYDGSLKISPGEALKEFDKQEAELISRLGEEGYQDYLRKYEGYQGFEDGQQATAAIPGAGSFSVDLSKGTRPPDPQSFNRTLSEIEQAERTGNMPSRDIPLEEQRRTRQEDMDRFYGSVPKQIRDSYIANRDEGRTRVEPGDALDRYNKDIQALKDLAGEDSIFFQEYMEQLENGTAPYTPGQALRYFSEEGEQFRQDTRNRAQDVYGVRQGTPLQNRATEERIGGAESYLAGREGKNTDRNRLQRINRQNISGGFGFDRETQDATAQFYGDMAGRDKDAGEKREAAGKAKFAQHEATQGGYRARLTGEHGIQDPQRVQQQASQLTAEFNNMNKGLRTGPDNRLTHEEFIRAKVARNQIDPDSDLGKYYEKELGYNIRPSGRTPYEPGQAASESEMDRINRIYSDGQDAAQNLRDERRKSNARRQASKDAGLERRQQYAADQLYGTNQPGASGGMSIEQAAQMMISQGVPAPQAYELASRQHNAGRDFQQRAAQNAYQIGAQERDRTDAMAAKISDREYAEKQERDSRRTALINEFIANNGGSIPSAQSAEFHRMNEILIAQGLDPLPEPQSPSPPVRDPYNPPMPPSPAAGSPPTPDPYSPPPATGDAASPDATPSTGTAGIPTIDSWTPGTPAAPEAPSTPAATPPPPTPAPQPAPVSNADYRRIKNDILTDPSFNLGPPDMSDPVQTARGAARAGSIIRSSGMPQEQQVQMLSEVMQMDLQNPSVAQSFLNDLATQIESFAREAGSGRSFTADEQHLAIQEWEAQKQVFWPLFEILWHNVPRAHRQELAQRMNEGLQSATADSASWQNRSDQARADWDRTVEENKDSIFYEDKDGNRRVRPRGPARLR